MAAANLGETVLADASCQRAFDLRQKLSEQEKLIIEGSYYSDWNKAQRTYQFAIQLYPRAPHFHINLATIFAYEGQFELSLKEWQEALKLSPESGLVYQGVIYSYLALNRVREAEAIALEAQRKGVNSTFEPVLYDLAFYRGDTAEMGRQAASAMGKPGTEDVLFAREADTAAYFGQLRKARELSRKAANSALRAGQKETAATYDAVCALREALFGNSAEARLQATLAKTLATGRDLDYGVALALAYAGNAGLAKELSNRLATKFPDDTVIQLNYLLTVRAKLVLNSANPQEALDILGTATPYEIDYPGEATLYSWGAMYPAYVRGEAYLVARQGSQAAAEFQKILDHRGIVLYEPIGPLAHLQLGRAYAMQGDTAKAKAAYQDFLTLWENADPDIPILIAAKSEYSKLQ